MQLSEVVLNLEILGYLCIFQSLVYKMSKRRILQLIDDIALPLPSVIRWDRCIICQDVKDAPLIHSKYCGLKSLGEDLIAFNNLGGLPSSIPFSKLNDEGLVNSLITNSAKFHKICSTKYDKHKLERLKKMLPRQKFAPDLQPQNMTFHGIG